MIKYHKNYRNKKNHKNYQVLAETKVKIDGEWKDAVVYICMYVNVEGMIWVRLREDFLDKFELKEDE